MVVQPKAAWNGGGFTDSLKGLDISKPFMPDVRPVFEKRGFQLLTHRAQWGGAVHFTSMVGGPIDPARPRPPTSTP